MPVTSLDQAQKRESQIKQALAGLGEAPDVAKKRELGKKLRRAQRLRRRLLTEAERTAKADAHAPKIHRRSDIQALRFDIEFEQLEREIRIERDLVVDVLLVEAHLYDVVQKLYRI